MEEKIKEIYIAFDGKKFFNKEECEKHETFQTKRIKEQEVEEEYKRKVLSVVNDIIETKYEKIIHYEDFMITKYSIDIGNVFVSRLNQISANIHKQGGMNGGANLIVTNPNNESIVYGALNFNSRYKIIYDDDIDESVVYVMNNKLLDTKVNKKDLRMFGVINIDNRL